MKGITRITILAIGLVLSTAAWQVSPAHSSTVSGQVTIPDSDAGYKPWVNGMTVRVEGTDIASDVASVDGYAGNFSLPDVPAGNLTLVLEEAAGQDTSTPSLEESSSQCYGE